MPTDSLSAIDRVDPICGRKVNDGSPYRRFHGGIVFHFCSDECCTRFASGAPIFGAVPDATEGAPPAPARVVDATGAAVSPAPAADAERAPDRAAAAVSHAVATPAPGLGRAAPSIEGAAPPAGARLPERSKLGALDFFAPFVAWRERRFAAACCRQMLELYRTVAATHPELSGPPLYRHIVMARSGASRPDADAVLGFAEQSFAAWPVERSLNFRDVVHYVVVQEFSVSHKNALWLHANLNWVVCAGIPHNL